MEINLTGTKQRIVDAALDLFSRRGFVETGIRDITSAVGIKESSLYNHFASKGAILDYILDRFKQFCDSSVPTAEALERLDADIDSILSCLHITFPENMTKCYMQSVSILFQEAGRNAAIRKYVVEFFILSQQQFVADVLRRLIKTGALDIKLDVDFWSRLHVSTIYAAMGRHAIGAGEDRADFRGHSTKSMLRTMYETMFMLHGTRKN